MLARLFIGLGEAAYGSVGLAVVLMVFAPSKRASPHRRVHGRRVVRLGPRRLPRRHPCGPPRLALVLRRDGRGRPGAGRSSTSCSSTTRSSLANQHPGNAVADAGLRHPAAGPAAHPGLHPLGGLCLPRQRPAAVRRRLAVRLAAQLPQPRLRPRARQGRRRRGRLHPPDGRRHDRVRCHHRPAHPDPPDPQVDDLAGLRLAVAGAPAGGLRPGPGPAPAGADRGRRVLRRRRLRSGRRHGGEPDSRLDPGHRLRHADAVQQPSRPGRRPGRGGPARRPDRAGPTR